MPDILKKTYQLRAQSLITAKESQSKPVLFHRSHIVSTRNLSMITLLSWLSMVGSDFFLNAGLLSWIYCEPSPFLLPPERMFELIPLGYLSLLFMAVLLCWLMVSHGVVGGIEGSLFGLKLGGFMGGVGALGLASISTAEYSFLFGWFIGQPILLGIAGAVNGSALGGTTLKSLSVFVSVFVVSSFIITIMLQASGLVPAALVIS